MMLATIKTKLKLAALAVTVALLGAAVFFIYRAGGDSARSAKVLADLKAAATAAQERAKAQSMSDQQLDKEMDRWRRKP
jgi:hypothetical protein